MGPYLTVEGGTTKGVFESYIEEVLAPILYDEQVMVMDNLSSHKAEKVSNGSEPFGKAGRTEDNLPQQQWYGRRA